VADFYNSQFVVGPCCRTIGELSPAFRREIRGLQKLLPLMSPDCVRSEVVLFEIQGDQLV